MGLRRAILGRRLSSNRCRNPDDGLTLVELIVAMMVFAILSLGVAYSMLATLQASRDSRGRQVAANLAAQEIDVVRSVGDIFTIRNATTQATVDGTVYTVRRLTDWVNSGLNSGDCGAGNGVLQHKKINVTVSWGNGGSTRTVRTDTIVAPDSKINDPTRGTIVVQVKRADGTGAAGVTVDVKPSSNPAGALALTESIPTTDENGCAFALKVTPGNYDVSISKIGYVTEKHVATEIRAMQKVSMGSATGVRFAYDKSVVLSRSYVNAAGVSAVVPTDLDLSYVNTYGTYLTRANAAVPALHPFTSGYTVIAGKIASASGAPASCDAIDPAKWPSATDEAGTTRSGWTVAPTAAPPGGSATAQVPMGVVMLSSDASVTITATSTTPPDESPAGIDSPPCATSMSYTLPAFQGTMAVALPFGSWNFRSSTGAVLGVAAGTAATAVTNGSSTAGIVTLDPRTPVAP